jgi:hypothetical protein
MEVLRQDYALWNYTLHSSFLIRQFMSLLWQHSSGDSAYEYVMWRRLHPFITQEPVHSHLHNVMQHQEGCL